MMGYSKKLIIRGDPKAQKRHRHHTVKKFVMTYDPSKSDKQDFLSVVHNEAPEVPLDCPIRVDIVFYFSRPKTHYGTGRNLGVLKSNSPKHHISRPDLDNLRKFVQDALTKVYWRDDSIICKGTTEKMYSTTPRTEIEITEIEYKASFEEQLEIRIE